MDKTLSNSKVSDRHSISHLLMSERLKETGSPKLILGSIIILFVILLSILVWASIIQIDETATGKGEILPIETIQPIQHLEGGIILNVFVKDGDVVEKNQDLFALSPEAFVSDLKRLKKRQNALEVEIFRLQSMLRGDTVAAEDFQQAITYKDVTEASFLQLQISNALMLYKQQMHQRKYNREQLASRLNQEKHNLENIKKELFHIAQRKKLLESELSIFGALDEKRATSKLNVLNTEDRLQEVLGDLQGIIREQTSIETTIMELENKLKTLEYNQENLALEQINDLTSELLEVREQIARSQDRVNRLVIKSPVRGIVKGLSITPGTVIAGAEAVFVVVPLSENLVANLRLSTNDIGHIKIGDPVRIKVDTYDFSAYGQIPGYVESISASTFVNEENKPYYLAIVKLQKNYLGDVPKTNLVLPGMTVVGDIRTSRKSLMKYLLKPINRTFNDAFKER